MVSLLRSRSGAAKNLEALGFVERKSDANDRRAKVVMFSKRGLQLLDVLHKAVVRMEQKMADRVGVAAVRQVTRTLRQYVEKGTSAVEANPTRRGRRN